MITRLGSSSFLKAVDLGKLLEEEGTPDPKLLEGNTWDLRRYEEHVDRRIFFREEMLLKKLGIQREAFGVALRFTHDKELQAQVAALMAGASFSTLRASMQEIRNDERAFIDVWLKDRMERCERCGSKQFQWHALLRKRSPRRLCEECTKYLGKRQRTSSTNIEPALATARQHKLPATLTLNEWKRTIKHLHDRCAYCGHDWNVVEHVTPTRRRGGTTFTNCLPACNSCNRFKGSRTVEEWIDVHDEGARQTRLQQALDWLVQNGRAVS